MKTISLDFRIRFVAIIVRIDKWIFFVTGLSWCFIQSFSYSLLFGLFVLHEALCCFLFLLICNKLSFTLHPLYRLNHNFLQYSTCFYILIEVYIVLKGNFSQLFCQNFNVSSIFDGFEKNDKRFPHKLYSNFLIQ